MAISAGNMREREREEHAAVPFLTAVTKVSNVSFDREQARERETIWCVQRNDKGTNELDESNY